MPFNGSGVFTRAMNWVSDATAGTKIRADRHDSEDNNFASGLSNTICRDGQSTILADIPWNAKRITNLGDPVNAGDALNKQWAQANLISGAYVADTPPAAAQAGNLWWDSDSGNLFLKYSDGTSTQWIQVNIAPPVLPEVPTPKVFKRTVFYASSTAFQFDATTLTADIEVLGGGGGGATCAAGAVAGSGAACAGGGGGGYAKKLITLTEAIRAATKTITVGSGGNPGAIGTLSRYADTVYTVTGTPGVNPVSNGIFNATLVTRPGGTPGVGAGGDINVQGSNGGTCMSFGSVQTAASTAAAVGGMGGNGAGPFGGGGGTAGSITATTSASASAGGNGGAWGAGGGGGCATNAVGAVPTSGAGSDGCVIITEYR